MDSYEMLQLVSFRVGKELFVLSITQIQEIIRPTEIVAIPRSPEFVEGVINLRGRIIPVIDLRKRFYVEAVGEANKVRIIVAEIDDVIVGLMVDAVEEVLRIDTSHLDNAPSIAVGIEQKFVQGIVKNKGQMLILLNVNELFNTDEAQLLKSVR